MSAQYVECMGKCQDITIHSEVKHRGYIRPRDRLLRCTECGHRRPKDSGVTQAKLGRPNSRTRDDKGQDVKGRLGKTVFKRAAFPYAFSNMAYGGKIG